MGALQNILFSLLALAIAFGYQTYRDLSKPYPKPELGKYIKEFKPFFDKSMYFRCDSRKI